MFTDPNTNSIVATGDVGRGYGLTLDDIEEWLTRGGRIDPMRSREH
jgi:hypothetical protein